LKPKASAPGSAVRRRRLVQEGPPPRIRFWRACADRQRHPLASALGNPTGRDPGQAVRTYHEGPDSDPQL